MSILSFNPESRSTVIDNVAHQMATLAFKGEQKEALHILNELQLSSEQSAAISTILAILPRSEETTHAMKEKIVVALTQTPEASPAPKENENTDFTAAPSQVEYTYFSHLHQDLIFNIFHQCCKSSDIVALSSFSRINMHFNLGIKELSYKGLNLKTLSELCPKLTLWDPEKVLQHINPLAILKSYNEMAPYVENEEGITVFYYEELTMDELVAYGKRLKLKVDVSDYFLEVDRKLFKEEPNISIVTNHIFKGSRYEACKEQLDRVENRHRCQILTARKVVYHILHTFEISGQGKCLFRRYPLTFTRVRPLYKGKQPWSVGNSSQARLEIHLNFFDNGSEGMAGQRKFQITGQHPAGV